MNRFGYFPGIDAKNNASSFLEEQTKRNPEKIMLQWVEPNELDLWLQSQDKPLPHKQITFADFIERSSRVATGFQKTGIRNGDRVIVFLPMSLELYLSLAALQRIGAASVFFDSWARKEQIGICIMQVAPKAVIGSSKAIAFIQNQPIINSIIPIKVIPDHTTSGGSIYSLRDLEQSPSKTPIVAVAQEHTALITYTTGSSGMPKGANRTHRFLAAQHYALDRCFPYKKDAVDLPVFPIFSLNNIASGITTVIPAIDAGVPGQNDISILLAQIQTCECTCLTLSPPLLRRVATYCLEQEITLPELRRVLTGGAPISATDLREFSRVAINAETWVLYGSTEVEPISYIETKEMVAQNIPPSHIKNGTEIGVNVGKIDKGLRYKFLKAASNIVIEKEEDWHSFEVEHGEIGELVVAGEHVCEGYYKNPEAFARSKIRDSQGVIWHRTGDLGRIDHDDHLWLVGRIYNVITRDNQKLYPVSAETLIKALPFVREAAFVGMPSTIRGEEAAMVVIPQDWEALGEKQSEWRQEIEETLQKNRIPFDQIVFRQDIPMDPRHHSKVDYVSLRKILEKPNRFAI